MRIGIGLPNPVPGVRGTLIVDWARQAEARGFAGLATIDRIAYPSHDSLTALAAAAGATTRIGLMTNILLAPVYPPVLLAKNAASIDQLSGGRLTLGLAAGGRADDFAVTGRDFDNRGAEFDDALDLMHRAWRGEVIDGASHPVCPSPVDGVGVPVMIGGTGPRALRRMAKWATGWTAGGGGPDQVAGMLDTVRAAWRDAGRQGEPKLAALVYFSVGEDAEDESRGYLRHYYGFLGPYADRVADSALRTPQAINDTVARFADLGITDLYFDPTAARLDQIDRLADLVL
jgi:alkanesulfonate monooxygenase SsuD/methylene tetrahydromethanopterin reductase-like flavin-dependent oxidoreductase (luciferase family)